LFALGYEREDPPGRYDGSDDGADSQKNLAFFGFRCGQDLNHPSEDVGPDHNADDLNHFILLFVRKKAYSFSSSFGLME
jgi:hypothetical protein